MNEPLRYAFFGAGVFAALCLELLSKWKVPSWIVTSQPKASGRGKKILLTPVGETARNVSGLRDVPLLEAASASSDEAVLRMKNELPVNFSFVVDFGQLIREPLLAWEERVGCLNIHPSKLPMYRGAAPIQRALMDGEAGIGVSVFKLAARMDAGPILLSETIRVDPDDDFGSLRSKAALAGVRAFIDFESANPLDSWAFEAQDDALATYAPRISAEEERIDWKRPAREIANRVRALSPRPGAWTTLRGRRLLILKARESERSDGHEAYSPGELRFDRACSSARAGEGFVEIVTVQTEGGRPQPASAWRNGLRPGPGESLV